MPLQKIEVRLFAFAFSLRLCWWLAVMILGNASFVYYDSDQFILLAENLYQHGVFSRGSIESATGLFPDIARTPGYPIFLIPFRALGIPLEVVALLQLLLASFVPIWLYRSAVILNAPRKFLVALIPILDLSFVFISGTILSDGLFFTLLCLSIYLSLRELSKQGVPWLTALLLVALIWIRPIAVFLLPVFVFLFVFPPGGIQRKPSGQLLKGLMLFMLLFSLWPVRNYRHFGVFTYSSMSTNNLLLYNAAAAKAKAVGTDFTSVQHSLAREVMATQDWEHDPHATRHYLDTCRAKAVSIILEHPKESSSVIIKNLAGYFVKPPRSYFDLVFQKDFKYEPLTGFASEGSLSHRFNRFFSQSHRSTLLLSLYALVVNLITLALAIVGSVYAWKHHRRAAIFLITLLFYFWFLSVFTMTDARFRIPAIAALSLLSGFIPTKKGDLEKVPS